MEARFVSEEKYTALAGTQYYAVLRGWDVFSVLTSTLDEEVVAIGGPYSSGLFFTFQGILSDGGAV